MLPFIAGIAIGSLAILAVKNRKNLKDKISKKASDFGLKTKKRLIQTKEELITKIDKKTKKEEAQEKPKQTRKRRVNNAK